MLAPGRCLFTTGIHTHSNQRKSEARISNSCKSLVAAMGKHSSAPRFEITNVSIPEHRGYRGARRAPGTPNNCLTCLWRWLLPSPQDSSVLLMNQSHFIGPLNINSLGGRLSPTGSCQNWRTGSPPVQNF